MAGAKRRSFKQWLIDYAKGPKGLVTIGEEIRYAFADIRQKVIEEGMYGRATTPPFEEVGIHGKMEPIQGKMAKPAKTDKAAPAPAIEPVQGSKTEYGRGDIEVSVRVSFKDRCQEVFDQRPPEGPEDPSQAPEHD